MKLSQMEYFLAVAETLNFTEAAKSLYISQPALSKQIALLEEELGTKLFIRTSRKVVLTAAGKKFEEDLKRIREELEKAKKRAYEIGKSEQMTIKIGCFDGKICHDFLPLVYNQIHKVDEAMKITLLMGSFEENRIALERGEIDIMLTLSKDFLFQNDAYQMKKILKRRGVLVFSKNVFPDKKTESIDISDFQKMPLILVQKQEGPSMFKSVIEDLSAAGIKNPEIIEVKNSLTLFSYLELGYGYTILSDTVARENPMLGMFELPENMETWVIAVWKKNHPIADILMDSYNGNT